MFLSHHFRRARQSDVSADKTTLSGAESLFLQMDLLSVWISFSQLVQVIAYLAKDASEKDVDQWALIKPSIESNCVPGISRATGQSSFHDFQINFI